MAKITQEFEVPIREVTRMLEEGGVIGLATDTTYALVAVVSSKRGVERLREMRKLPPSKPLALLLPDLATISKFAYVDRAGYRLIKRLTPGRYTFILRATKEVPRLTLTKQRTVGIRICGMNVIDALCKTLDAPLISASAARPEPGDGYAETADEVAVYFPDVDMIIDSGPVSPEASTIIDLTGTAPVITREGSGEIADLLGG